MPHPDSAIDAETSRLRTEWSRWRGGVDQKLEDLPKEVANAVTNVQHSVDQLGIHLNRRLDAQDRDMEDMRRLQREANGRTGTTEKAVALLNAEVVQIRAEKVSRTQTFRWRVAQILAAGGTGAGIAMALTYLHIL